LPDGSRVVIRIEPQELTLPERQGLVQATAGAWGDDPSTDAIFAALLRERCADVGRDVRFDDPACAGMTAPGILPMRGQQSEGPGFAGGYLLSRLRTQGPSPGAAAESLEPARTWYPMLFD